MKKKKMTKKKTTASAPKSNFCDEVAQRPKKYSTNGLAVRKFEWHGTVARPTAEYQSDMNFNKNLKKESARPKTEQTVSLNPDGAPDLERLRKQVKDKGSKPID